MTVLFLGQMLFQKILPYETTTQNFLTHRDHFLARNARYS